ncbi:alpha/beta hydrolase [Oculatella sp. LEGE 06141]|uniref:alpha/beta hydrolase n=1 Tax=Oculatella sp. LEGE 06141 TaxID=1828648 RepID=UPI00187EB22F|nr:alpha/beta hydrolase [Oculatella sp. LEGE 06141]MBE9179577.1 alpha/beta hydrolase [Oculatella sp. LEGE 06141]
MKHVEGTFKGFGDLNLYCQSWYPTNQTQASVVMVHGLGGHSDLFNPAVDYLVVQGYEVHTFDLRGHGRSPGQRGHINTWAEFREDLRAFLQQIYQQRSGYPCFLWGHSLGGTIALDYALRSPQCLQGLIVSAPALGKVCISPVKLAVGRLLSRTLPRFSLKLGIRNDLCSRDPEICALYLKDALRHEYGSARLATEFFATVDWIYKHASDLQIPLLLLHGSADQVTFPEESRVFFQQIMFPDKEHREYPGHYHDLYIDLEYQGILADMEDWFERHSQSATTSQSSTFCIP